MPAMASHSTTRSRKTGLPRFARPDFCSRPMPVGVKPACCAILLLASIVAARSYDHGGAGREALDEHETSARRRCRRHPIAAWAFGIAARDSSSRDDRSRSARATDARVCGAMPSSCPSSRRAYQPTLMPASSATSSRRKPIKRRPSVCGSPTSVGAEAYAASAEMRATHPCDRSAMHVPLALPLRPVSHAAEFQLT